MNGFDENDAFEAAVPLSQRAMARGGRVVEHKFTQYLDVLNPEQRAAAVNIDGPLLILAGAGTGKTKTLMSRIAHIDNTLKGTKNPDGSWFSPAKNILAVTFTNKAAKEMRNRLEKVPYALSAAVSWLGTFHAVSTRMLRNYAELVGLKSTFTILDTDDQLRVLRELIRLGNIDEKRWPPRMLAGIIDGWKNRALTPAQVPSHESAAFNNRGTELYEAYQRRLLDLNCCDFGDLLLHCVEIFKTHPDVLAQYQRQFRYILVDEYQDTNVAQYLWLRLLAQKDRNICCVGDDDQSIYGWRGAEVDNILRFEKDFPGAHVVRLEQNYRSTPHILAAASAVIAHNQGRLGKTLWTAEEAGEKLRLIGYWDGEEEARSIGEAIEGAQRGRGVPRDYSLDDMAILVRASHQMRAFEDRFLTIGLPYRVIGGPRFYERAEIRDAMAYFRLVISPADDLAFERIVNLPKRGIGDMAMQKIQTMARSLGMPLLEGARALLAQGGLGGKGGAQLRLFVDNIDRWHGLLASVGPVDYVEGVIEPLSPSKALSHIALAQMILDESGYTAMWQNEKTPEAEGRLENLKELVKALDGFDSLQGFLEHVSLIMDNESEEAAEKVTIMTLHAAKGLEFPMVFLPGWEEGLFPSQRSMDEQGKKGLEEERRLAYVGITRAEEVCTITFASNRRVYGQWQSQLPSRFIDELPPAHVDVQTAPSLYGGAYGAAAPSFSAAFDERVAAADGYDSPGWRRMQERGNQRGISQPRETRNVTIDMQASSPYGLGERVFHQKFGYGEVMGIEGDKLDIEFDRAGSKKVVAAWVIPAHQVENSQTENDVPF